MSKRKYPRPRPGQTKAPLSKKPVRRRGKILYSLILLLLVSGLAPLLITTFWLVGRNREALEASERLLQLDQTRSIAQQARLYLQSMHNQVETIAKTFEFGSDPRAVRQRVQSVTAPSLVDFLEEDRVAAVTVFDREGRFVTAGYSLDNAQIDASMREALVEGLKGHEHVSSPIVSEALLDTLVIMSSPVRASPGGDGEPWVEGVVAAMVSLKPIAEMVQQKGNDRRSVFVVDDELRLVAHSDPETLFSGTDLSKTPIVRAFFDSRQQASGSVNFELARDGEPHQMLGTYTPIGDLGSPLPFLKQLGWGAIVQAEEEAVFFSAREIVKDSFFIAVLAASLAIALAVVFAGRLSRPIAQLAESARRLSAGDFSHEVAVTSGNEIGEFAETFNLMVAEIRGFIERLRRAAEENKEMFMGAVTSLAAAIDAKDPYTAGHSERVAHYSATIAKIMKLPEEQVETIRISALMHDVGKIGIQDSILGKTGPLTDEEFEIMKTHPTKGAAIMEHVPQLKSMIPGMKYHHENVDGSGYPEGLKGDEIPLTAKIVSVADTFDAMTTNRPYQKAMEITYVFTRMRSFIGKKFEAHIVEALITAYEEGLVRPNMKEVAAEAEAAVAPAAEEAVVKPVMRDPLPAPVLGPPPPNALPPLPLPAGAFQFPEEGFGIGPAPSLMNRTG